MASLGTILAKFLGVFALIGLNGFFVAVEFAVVAARRTRIERLAEEGHPTARLVAHWLETRQSRDRLIAAAQIGITMASLALGYLGESAVAEVIAPLIAPWSAQARGALASLLRLLPLALSLIVVTSLHVILGEQVPKVASLRGPERVTLLSARPMAFFIRLFWPLIWVLDRLATATLGLLGLRDAAGRHGLLYTVEELKDIVQESQETGVLEEEESEMIRAVFDFGDMLARQVMVPRTEMVAIAADAPFSEVVRLALDHPFTKFPVYEGHPDNIIGIMHVRDILRALATQYRVSTRLIDVALGAGEGRETSVRGLMREALFLPETIRVNDLLAEFRARRQHIAILLDEYGGTAGLVTLEDLLEEIVGEVHTFFEQGEPQIQRLPDGSALVDGLTLIEEVNQAFGLALHDPNYDTIAGFVIGKLGRIARVGDTVEADGVRLRVEAMDGLRIARLSLFPAQRTPPSQEGPS